MLVTCAFAEIKQRKWARCRGKREDVAEGRHRSTGLPTRPEKGSGSRRSTWLSRSLESCCRLCRRTRNCPKLRFWGWPFATLHIWITFWTREFFVVILFTYCKFVVIWELVNKYYYLFTYCLWQSHWPFTQFPLTNKSFIIFVRTWSYYPPSWSSLTKLYKCKIEYNLRNDTDEEFIKFPNTKSK